MAKNRLLLGCASSGLIAVAAMVYPSAARSTGVGWATAIGRFGSFRGPLAVGSLVAAHWSVGAIFTGVAGATAIGAVARALLGLLPRADAARHRGTGAEAAGGWRN